MSIREEVLSTDDRAAINAPIGDARAFPREAYTSKIFYELEQERIFQRRWTALCFEAQLPEPGDARPFDEFGLPLVAVRGADRQLRVFHNVCSYDGCEVVMVASRGMEYLRVNYHGWRYDLQGKLIATPYWDGSAEGHVEVIDLGKRDLVEVSSDTFLGVLFVDLGGRAGPFEDFIRPLRELSTEYDLEALRVCVDPDGAPGILDGDEVGAINANWKTVVENDCINVLHEGHTHELYRQSPDVPRVDDDCNPRFVWHLDGALLGFEYKESDVPNTYAVPEGLPPLGSDPNARPKSGYFLQLYPNLSVLLHPQFVAPSILYPRGPGQTVVTGSVSINAAASSEADELLVELAEALGSAFDEDLGVVESVQRARRSPLSGRHFYAPFWDAGHHRFNQLVLADLEA